MAKSVYRISGTPNIHYYYCDGSTSSFVAGDLVRLDSYGYLQIATAGSVLGIALKDSVNNSTTPIPVDVIAPDDSEFVMKYASTTSNALKGAVKDLTPTSGAQVVATTATSPGVAIVDLDPRDSVGKSGGRLIVKFLPDILQVS